MDILNVCYATDDGFIMQVSISLISLLENCKDIKEINIYILDDGISPKNKKRMDNIVKKYNHNISFIDVKSKLKDIILTGVDSWTNSTYTTYARVFLGELLPDDVEWILYLDGDTIILKTLSGLEGYQNIDKCLGMVKEASTVELRSIIGLDKNANYYNAGVLWINVLKWKEIGAEEILINHLRNIRSRYPYVDQDLINVCLKDHIKDIDMRYNMIPCCSIFNYRQVKKVYSLNENIYYNEIEYDEECLNPIVIHFAGGFLGRPWFLNSIHPWKNQFKKYYDISPWKDVKLKKEDVRGLLKLQRLLFKYLPRNVYVLLHKYSTKINVFFLKKGKQI